MVAAVVVVGAMLRLIIDRSKVKGGGDDLAGGLFLFYSNNSQEKEKEKKEKNTRCNNDFSFSFFSFPAAVVSLFLVGLPRL